MRNLRSSGATITLICVIIISCSCPRDSREPGRSDVSGGPKEEKEQCREVRSWFDSFLQSLRREKHEKRPFIDRLPDGVFRKVLERYKKPDETLMPNPVLKFFRRMFLDPCIDPARKVQALKIFATNVRDYPCRMSGEEILDLGWIYMCVREYPGALTLAEMKEVLKEGLRKAMKYSKEHEAAFRKNPPKKPEFRGRRKRVGESSFEIEFDKEFVETLRRWHEKTQDPCAFFPVDVIGLAVNLRLIDDLCADFADVIEKGSDKMAEELAMRIIELIHSGHQETRRIVNEEGEFVSVPPPQSKEECKKEFELRGIKNDLELGFDLSKSDRENMAVYRDRFLKAVQKYPRLARTIVDRFGKRKGFIYCSLVFKLAGGGTSSP